MTNTQEIKKMYQKAKEKAIARAIKDLVLNVEMPYELKLIGRTKEYLTYWSNSRHRELRTPSEWPICYFQYAPDTKKVTLIFGNGHATYNDHSMAFYEGEMREWNKKEGREKTIEECTSQYSIRQMSRALRTLRGKGFDLERVLSQISREQLEKNQNDKRTKTRNKERIL